MGRTTRCVASAVIALALALVFGLKSATAQQKEPLNLEWVQNDVEGIGVLLKLMPVESQNIEALKESLRDQWSIDDDKLGFDANRVRFGKGYGYSSIYVDVFVFNGNVAYYQIGVDGSLDRWSEIRERIIDAWRQNEGPEFEEKGSRISHQKKFDGVFESYFRAAGSELGEMKPAEVPADLQEAYEYLTSPMNNSYIGEGVCGLGGPVLEGKTSIDALVNAKRVDLIENVLRGYNPGGRIFAAIALMRMKRQGLKLSSETEATLKKVVSLDIPVSTCSGCIVNSGRTSRDVIQEFTKK